MTQPTLHDLEQRELELWQAYLASVNRSTVEINQARVEWRKAVDALVKMKLEKPCIASA